MKRQQQHFEVVLWAISGLLLIILIGSLQSGLIKINLHIGGELQINVGEEPNQLNQQEYFRLPRISNGQVVYQREVSPAITAKFD